MGSRPGRDTWTIGQAHRGNTRTSLNQKHVGMAMIAATKFNDLVTASIRPGKTQGAHGSFSTGIDKAHHLDRGDALDHQLGKCIFGLRGSAKAKAMQAGLDNSLHYTCVGMAQDHWSPGLHVIEVTI